MLRLLYVAVGLALLTGPSLLSDRVRLSPQAGSLIGRSNGHRAGRLTDSTIHYASFEFAPSSGAGMGSACACVNPTGAKGEPLVFTRASTGMCTKSNETTGIQNGDLVNCGSGLARVMPGGDGSGGLGLSVWEARTNAVLRSQELENAAWVQNADSAPRNTTVTANAATAPDGTVTADQLDTIATTGAQFSTRAQLSVAVASTTASCSVYLRGVSGSGSTDFTINSTNAVCSFVSTSWTECLVPATAYGVSVQVAIGNNSNGNGGVARPTQSIYVWGAQCETGGSTGPHIPTAGTAVTRAAEDAHLAVSGIGTTASISASIVATGPFTTLAGLVGLQTNGTSPALGALINGTTQLQCFQQGGSGFLSLGGTQSAADHVYCYNLAGVYPQAASLVGKLTSFTQQSTTGGDLITVDRIGIGSWSDAHPLNGVVKLVCADPVTTRCR